MGLFGSKKVEENGLLKAYNVIYLGGWSYENAKKGQLELKIFEDRFEFLPSTLR